MTRLNDKQIADVIKSFDPAKFSPKGHDEGFEVIYDRKNKQLLQQRPGFMRTLWGNSSDLAYFYVKRTALPCNISGVSFSWKDGRTDFSLDFLGSFSLEIKNETDAQNLVKELHYQNGPAESLQLLIERAIHDTIREKLPELSVHTDTSNSVDPLWKFIHEESKDGLAHKVSDKIKKTLNIPHFEMGLRLLNLPPEDISIEDYITEFRLQGSDRNWSLKTTADLRLHRLQNVKKSGYHNRDQIKDYICESIKLAVRDHIQGKTFYSFVEHFDTENKADSAETVIKELIKQDISNKAEAIGYRLNIFHTLPNIQSLQLKDGLRIELPGTNSTAEANGKCAFRTKDSTAPVSLDLALNVFANDFSKLKSLMQLGDDNLLFEIEKLVLNTCRDVIIKIPRKGFNLNFSEPPILGGSAVSDNVLEDNKSVERRLIEALVRAFERYGLRIEVIHITQAQTEDAGRYDGLVGKSTKFELKISAQADSGKGDDVEYDGVFEVLALVENGWEAFERKDNGFRRQSPERSGVRMAEFLEMNSAMAWQDEFENGWRNQCLKDQLKDISRRISDIVEGKLSKIPNIANRGRTLKQDQEIMEIVSTLAKSSIADEFGLEIAIRSLKRLDSETEKTEKVVRRLLLDSETKTLEKTLEHDLAKQDHSNKNELDLMIEEETILNSDSDRANHIKNLSSTSGLKIRSETPIDDSSLRDEFISAGHKLPKPPE